MRAAIYNPYLDTLGGGERYAMAVATTLAEHGYRVEVEWKDEGIKNTLEKRFNIDLKNVIFVESVNKGDDYDFCFWVSDGSIPLLRARKNFLHFQFPFKDVSGKTLFNRMKFFRIDKIICNSYFTKSFVDSAYGVDSLVIYPPVDALQFKPGKKENLIISIGRFSQLTQAKRQDVLLRAFKKFYDSGFRDWRLVFAGGTEVGVDDFVAKLRKSAKGYPVKIMESPAFSQIRDLYSEAKIFWSAAGYGVDEKKEPLKVEHFGITLVEAMAAGVVPLAYDAGGHKEIVAHGENGYLWKGTAQLLANTASVIKTRKLLKEMSLQARKDSKVYEYERFSAEIKASL